MNTVWTIWILLIIVSFAVLEKYAFTHEKNTLSRYVYYATKAFPLLIFLLGLFFGGVAVHFWWNFCPDGGIGNG